MNANEIDYTKDPANALFAALLSYLRASRPGLGCFLQSSHAVAATNAVLAARENEANACTAMLKALRVDASAFLGNANASLHNDIAKRNRKLLKALDAFLPD